MPGDGWKYDWYKGKTDLLITGSTFTNNSVSPSNTGDYHCTAKRGDFSVDSETLQVRVEGESSMYLFIVISIVEYSSHCTFVEFAMP